MGKYVFPSASCERELKNRRRHDTIEVIKFQEILIAALGLLAVPKSYKLDISTIENDEKLLPETTTRTLEENKDTIHKLSKMSNTISQMAKEYEDAAASIVTDEELEQQERANREIFEEELFANLDGKEDNLLYDDLASNNEGILDEIFDIMLKKDVITRKEIVQIFANHNNYIMGFSTDSKEDEYVAQNDIDEVVRAINSSYRISKINFVWKKKLDEKKKTMSTQLNSVSEALSNLANQITTEEQEPYKEEKEEIKNLIPEEKLKGFRGEYLELAQQLKKKQEKIEESQASSEEDEKLISADFDFVLFASTVIDYDYIISLISKYTYGEKFTDEVMTKEQLVSLLKSCSNLLDEKDDIIDYVETLEIGVGLNEEDIKNEYKKFKETKRNNALIAIAKEFNINEKELIRIANDTIRQMSFSGDMLDGLFPRELNWKERAKLEEALMEKLIPILNKMAEENTIRGLDAYESK